MENQPLKYNSNNLRDELYLRTGRGVKNVKLSEMKRYYKKDDFLYDMLGQQMLN